MGSTDFRLALSKLRRRLTFWRVVAVLAVVALLWALLARGGGMPGIAGAAGGEHVARIRIDGFITGSQRQLDLIDSLRRDRRVKAVIVRINSPGGGTAGSEAIYRALRRVAEKKPVVTVMDSVAASGGYMVALAGDRVFASGNSITGSIGVIVQWPELHELLGKIGVRMQAVRSGPLKALPSGYEPTPEEARRMIVDELGDEVTARKWLEREHKVAFSTRVVERRPRRPLLQQLGLPGVMARWMGLSPAEAAARELLERLAGVDGLLSVWHPALMMGMKRQDSE